MMQTRVFTIAALLLWFFFDVAVVWHSTSRSAGIALLISMGLTAAGYVVGLLFSVPKATAGSSHNASDKDAQSSQSARQIYSLNTNLEEVADWLTKIIVGLGLVEAKRIITFMLNASAALGATLASAEPTLNQPASQGISMGIILSFPPIGFLLGFFSVRLYVSRALYNVDKAILQPIDIQAKVTAFVAAANVPKQQAGVETKPADARDAASAVRETSNVVRRIVTPSALASFSGGRLLWVDDRPPNNEYLINAFRELGIDVTLSTSTDDALAKVDAGNRYDAIITDMGRPPDLRAGYTLLAALKQRGVATPTLVYAGSASEEHRREAREAGAVDSTNRPQTVFEFVTRTVGSRRGK